LFRKCKLIKSNYKLDLGVKFDTKYSFNDRINYIRYKTFAKLGFLKRSCQKLKDKSALITLYNFLVRSHFDYALLIWHPTTSK
jgi:hypothetical protein